MCVFSALLVLPLIGCVPHESATGPSAQSEQKNLEKPELQILELGEQARKNLDLVVQVVRPTDYWRTISIPGVVADRPGISDRGVTSPAASAQDSIGNRKAARFSRARGRYPPGTSKWNKIEHRLFCHITRNSRDVPLESHQIVVSLVSSTRTNEGLEVHCTIDSNDYPKGRKITDSEMSQIKIKRNAFHGDWNYEIKPRKLR